MVDWSAANAPNRGKDSIWLGLTVRGRCGLRLTHLENPATARERHRTDHTTRGNQSAPWPAYSNRFRFPIRLSRRYRKSVGQTRAAWRNLWQELDDRLIDHDDNRNNRFDVAEGLNAALTGEPFPFGVYTRRGSSFLVRRNRRPYGGGGSGAESADDYATFAPHRRNRSGNWPGPARSAVRYSPAYPGSGRYAETPGSPLTATFGHLKQVFDAMIGRR